MTTQGLAPPASIAWSAGRAAYTDRETSALTATPGRSASRLGAAAMVTESPTTTTSPPVKGSACSGEGSCVGAPTAVAGTAEGALR